MNEPTPVRRTRRTRHCTCKQRDIGEVLGVPYEEALTALAALRWHPDGSTKTNLKDLWELLGRRVSTGWLSTQLAPLRPHAAQEEPAA